VELRDLILVLVICPQISELRYLSNMDVKVVVLPENLHTYLLHVFQTYTRSGMDPGECEIAAATWQRINNPQTIDYSQLGPVDAKVTPEGVTVDINPTLPPNQDPK
jgi:hypothetical protein